MLAALLVSCSEPSSAPVQTDWDAWPWMTADIPTSVRLAARLAPATASSTTYSVTLTFSNTTGESATASFGACSFGIRLYADSTGLGMPAWDNRPPPNTGCILPLYVVQLGPHASADRQVGLFDPAIAASVLSHGRYRVVVTWRSSATGAVETVPADMISLP